MSYVVTIGTEAPYVVRMPRLSDAFVVIRKYEDLPFRITLKRVSLG